MSQIEHSPELYCPGCGYDLRALMGDRCPECGMVVDLAAIAKSEIPWSHRARIGWISAFLRTVWVACAGWKLLARQAAQPVSYRDAQKFRWLVVLLASIPLCAAALVVRALNPFKLIDYNLVWAWPISSLPFYFDFEVCALAGLELWAVPSIAIILFFSAVTGIGSFLFHPKDLPIALQNRAIALSYYTSASLVYLFVPVVLLWIAATLLYLVMWSQYYWFQVYALSLLLGGFSLLSLILLFWWRTIRLLRGVTHCSSTRAVVAAILLPLLWGLMAAICLGLFPVLVGLVRLMIESVRH